MVVVDPALFLRMSLFVYPWCLWLPCLSQDADRRVPLGWVALLNNSITKSAPLCTEEASCFSTGGFLKPQCLMWSALNHTTCSLNMNDIHLCSATAGLSSAPDCHCLCGAIVQRGSETWRRQWPWSQWSDFDPANPAIRLLREERTSNPGRATCALCSPNVSLPPPSTSLSDGTKSEY